MGPRTGRPDANTGTRHNGTAADGLANKVTTIVVPHRLSTLRKADVIYVMESRRIVETGGYHRLLNTGGRFADLHALQFS